MPVYLDTRGNSVLSVAICDRCSRKFPYVDLQPDPNFPGMRVCKDDLDNFDPWRLPARQTENIALRFPRPDVSIALTPNLLNTQGNANNPQQYDNLYLQGILPAANSQGNLNTESNFTYTLLPSIGAITPNSGSKSGGYPATITGVNFTHVKLVMLGGVSAPFTVVDDNTITITVPAYGVCKIVDILMQTKTNNALAKNIFTYTP